MYTVQIIQNLAATRSRRDKEQIIYDAFLNDSEQFFIGARLALDPLIVFNVAKVAEILEDDGAAGTFSFADFLDLVGRLRRDLIGHSAREAIHAAAERCHVPTWNGFYRRILLKDLKAGIDAKTMNKVLRSLLPTHHDEAQRYMIPVFGCQLAHDGEAPAYQNKLHGLKLIDVKLDGVRALTVFDKEIGVTTLFSRSGLMISNFPELQTSLQTLLPRLPGSIVFDGELVLPRGSPQHVKTLSQRKEYHPDMALVQYGLFDIIPLSDFRIGHCDRSQRERHTLLAMLQESGLWTDTDGRVRVIPKIEVDLDTTDGQAAFAEFNQQAVLDGYDKVIIKDPEAPYVCKRTATWLKCELSSGGVASSRLCTESRTLG